jgi:putative aldouronate transport system permease protein
LEYGKSTSRTVFHALNAVFLIVLTLLCLLPFVHVIAVSLSSATAATAGEVVLWPVEFTTKSFTFVMQKKSFLTSMSVSLERVLIGVSINTILTVLMAYPLAKENEKFRLRTKYAWFIVFTMIFNGGLIPTYMVLRNLQMLDTIWALVLPTAVPVFNVILMLNFFRGLPKEISESAEIDGAGEWRKLWSFYLPLSLPSLATITLFSIVTHWNSWFDGLIYMNFPENYPLQSYMQTLVIQRDSTLLNKNDLELLQSVSDRTAKAAQILIGSLPVLLVYPFLQKYFMKGLVLGSIKE